MRVVSDFVDDAGDLHGWGANASVQLPMDAALNRADYDVVQLLRRIPEARVNAMRETIALNAHRLVYGIGQYPGDALETPHRFPRLDGAPGDGPRAFDGAREKF